MNSQDFSDKYQLLKRYWSLAVQVGNGPLTGLFKSGLKGSGLEWQELRPLAEGDDARLIDWKATARSGRPHIRLFEEERDLRLLLVLDFSPTMLADCGRAGRPKAAMARQLAFLLGYLAISCGDQVGWLIGHAGEVTFKPFSRDLGRLWQVHEELSAMSAKPDLGPAVAWSTLLQQVAQKCPREAMVLLFSDYGTVPATVLDSFGQQLAVLKSRDTIISLKINDPVERELPAAGLLWLTDPLSGSTQLFDTGQPLFRQEWAQAFHDKEVALKALFARLGLAHGQFWTNEEPTATLAALLGNKNGKK